VETEESRIGVRETSRQRNRSVSIHSVPDRENPAMRRPFDIILLGGLFGLFAAADMIQLVQITRGLHPDPPGLIVTHALTAVLAGLAAAGIWRTRPGTHMLVLAWGLVTAVMLAVLGPATGEPRETWRGYLITATSVALLAGAASWYVRNRIAGLRDPFA
jgi:hypothetical protein